MRLKLARYIAGRHFPATPQHLPTRFSHASPPVRPVLIWRAPTTGSMPWRDSGFRRGRIGGRFGSHLPGAHRLPTGPSTRHPEPGPGLRASGGCRVPGERLQPGARGCERGHALARQANCCGKGDFHAGGLCNFLQPPRRARTRTWWVSDGALAGKSLALLPPGLRASVRHKSPRHQLGISSCCDEQVWEIPKVC